MKVLITGGSGFIGTNTVQYFMKKGWEVLNLSHSKPRNYKHISNWHKSNVDVYEELRVPVLEFAPDYIIHFAGKTDFNGKRSEDYSVNVVGTQNVLTVAKECHGLKKVLFTSSALANKHRCISNGMVDYSPAFWYGQSKVEAEDLVQKNPPECDWAIIRPTNIWGPWQTSSYIHFFKTVLSGHYFHIGKSSIKKTFGYVGNTVFQIDALLCADTTKAEDKVFYLGDYEPYDIREWAEEIATLCGRRIPEIPHGIAKYVALAGDLISSVGVRAPLTSIRLKNMETDNVIDISEIRNIAYPLPFSRKEGVIETVKWINNNYN